MFSSIGLWRNTLCPHQHECSLPVCVFLHSSEAPSPEVDEVLAIAKEYDPFSAGDVSPPPPKRRRLHSPTRDKSRADPEIYKPAQSKARIPAGLSHQLPLAQDTVSRSTQSQTTYEEITRNSAPLPGNTKLASMARTVSPPPTKAAKERPQPAVKQPRKVEALTPRNVIKAPAQLKTRLAILQKLHEQIKAQNSKLNALDAKWKSLVLDPQELIMFALDEEEAATKFEGEIYRNTITQNIVRIKKMTTEEWVKKVSEWTGSSTKEKAQPKPAEKREDLGSVGLTSLSEQVAVLRHLRTSLEGLEQYGYVTKLPSAAEIASTQAGVTASKGFESCDRCATRFQVFPGRDDNGHLTSGGKCRYHWARANRQARAEPSHPCCNKPEGSEGCSIAETHVFAVKTPKRLAGILQFEHTPEKTDVRPLQPVSFDCEMGYTTLGMEVIRVTAVSWPDGRLLFDVFVRTYGEVLDLNTRFSGVSSEGYASAVPYSSDGQDDDVTSKGGNLRKVESPAAARQLLFDLISPETPLIGHAIENDLNVLRIIHPFIVDTVLLYPHPRGLPIRFGLKILSQKYLSRGIQTAGEAGHDSKEDAVATGDLVTRKVTEKWKMMKHEGWCFEDGILTAPEEATSLAGGQSRL
ncbi:RNA exonuclease 3 [Cladophialophora chaetospira]|uniref:RNA exonuclease 3 n=1 Tax=Cladophialophora chaetospira TaxID=386627 RepID=A0AA39CMS2_9EURO|nr:RNA exonuclease 3 [Cladophialophora chaetospira]